MEIIKQQEVPERERKLCAEVVGNDEKRIRELYDATIKRGYKPYHFSNIPNHKDVNDNCVQRSIVNILWFLDLLKDEDPTIFCFNSEAIDERFGEHLKEGGPAFWENFDFEKSLEKLFKYDDIINKMNAQHEYSMFIKIEDDKYVLNPDFALFNRKTKLKRELNVKKDDLDFKIH
jgi:hypothetical protein